MTDARTGERLGSRPPVPGLHVDFTWVCEVGGVRGRFQRGDWVALVHTADPHTRLRPSDEGTVTRYDPAMGSSTSAGTAEAPCPCSWKTGTGSA